MLLNFINTIKSIFTNLDKKIMKIILYGLRFCFTILLLSTLILVTYMFFIHNNIIFQIGLLVFEISLYFSADFIVSGIVVDSIQKQLL